MHVADCYGASAQHCRWKARWGICAHLKRSSNKLPPTLPSSSGRAGTVTQLMLIRHNFQSKSSAVERGPNTAPTTRAPAVENQQGIFIRRHHNIHRRSCCRSCCTCCKTSAHGVHNVIATHHNLRQAGHRAWDGCGLEWECCCPHVGAGGLGVAERGGPRHESAAGQVYVRV